MEINGEATPKTIKERIEANRSKEDDTTLPYMLRLDDLGADPINATIKPAKITGFTQSSKQMSKALREQAVSATLVVTEKISPDTIIKIPRAEDFSFYRVLKAPQKYKNPQRFPNSIWVQKIPNSEIKKAIKNNSIATLENLSLTDNVKEKLGI